MNKSQEAQKWHKDKHYSRSQNRAESFSEAIRLLYARSECPHIVETGTVRLKDDYGAGYSTVIFAECVSIFGGKLTTIDNSALHMDISRSLTTGWKDFIDYIVMDSVEALMDIVKPIDLLYLDSMDCPIDGDATLSQQHNLRELLAARHALLTSSMVLIDDVGFSNGGKAKLTHEKLLKENWKRLYQGQQSLWETPFL